MKSRTLCAFLIAMLLISPVAFGEIIEICDWDGNCGGNCDYSSPSAHADGDDYTDYSWGDGSNFTYTTEDGWFDYDYWVYVEAEVHLWLYDNETCGGLAFADADAACTATSESHDVYANVNLEDSGEHGQHVWDDDEDDEWPHGKYVLGYHWFDAYDAVVANHMAIAYAWVPEDSDCTAHVEASAHAWGGMYD